MNDILCLIVGSVLLAMAIAVCVGVSCAINEVAEQYAAPINFAVFNGAALAAIGGFMLGVVVNNDSNR